MGEMKQNATEFYTVIYRVVGPLERHQEWWKSIRSLFLAEDDPISITAIAKFDALEKLADLKGEDE